MVRWSLQHCDSDGLRKCPLISYGLRAKRALFGEFQMNCLVSLWKGSNIGCTLDCKRSMTSGCPLRSFRPTGRQSALDTTGWNNAKTWLVPCSTFHRALTKEHSFDHHVTCGRSRSPPLQHQHTSSSSWAFSCPSLLEGIARYSQIQYNQTLHVQ